MMSNRGSALSGPKPQPTSISYIGRKISSLRWLPSLTKDSATLSGCRVLVTGSWDDTENRLQIWTVDPLRREFARGAVLGSPQLQSTLTQAASITEIDSFDDNRLIVGSADGSATVYNVDSRTFQASRQHTWTELHSFTTSRWCSCTSVSASSDGIHIATGGEDGRINYFGAGRVDVEWSRVGIAGCSVRKVRFRTSSEVVSGNMLGQLQVWDVKSSGKRPALTMLDKADEGESMHGDILDLCVHPDQRSVVATGDSEGVVRVWDIRHPTYPMSITTAHEAPVWAIRFHPGNPDVLFTAGEDGSLLQWDTNVMRANRQHFSVQGDINVVNLMGATKSLGINALDVETDLLACGSDSEALIVVAPSLSS
eukprot:m.45005 g.45005  ORF g.45005 m.45005 type:complete len:368 (+) comp15106_c0_seq1:181-1284(+)